ncbi:putative ubiquitin-activating enzyme 5 [Blattamonas nauphoetae]|uniref:Ubiquitin-like modifier-activating enzyme 5 n=1 Tax=Blattamonas nauphoetae TaxID=2049346 RepID=A0ABQ9YKS7_9EUKA|nr:putative ubiquitin-activating enzyme 5 [Blattamonas nauphoetae]
MMDDKVNSENPYSRLMAIKKMGIVKNYDEIRQKSVAVVGIGGIGSVVVDHLTRCGIGKLIIFDYDKVELANMNRSFYTPKHARENLSKTDAAKQSLNEINPDVEIIPNNFDITTLENYERMSNILQTQGTTQQDVNQTPRKVDLVISCVDNHAARHAVNQVCLELCLCWFESGVSETAISGHVQFMQPGATACFECAPPLLVAEGIDEKSIKRTDVCSASLPTTMGIVAGILSQNALKYLLGFGEVISYIGYNALKDFFPAIPIQPNLTCSNKLCVQRQAEWAATKEKMVSEAKAAAPAPEKKESAPSSQFAGIEIIDESGEADQHFEVTPFLYRQYQEMTIEPPAAKDKEEPSESAQTVQDFQALLRQVQKKGE